MRLPPKLRAGPILVLSKDITLYYALYLPERTTASGYHQADYGRKGLQYDENEASFYWGLSIPVDVLPYKTASEITDKRASCLEAIKSWAPEFHSMLSVGDDDPENTDMLVTQLRASTQPKANWRTQFQHVGGDEGHPQVWIMGDAIHAMQPNRGQGGNQALADCADMLPQLLHLNSLASIGSAHPTLKEMKTACERYETAMIRRAFPWVRKSGGVSFPRINLDGFLGIVVRLVAKLVLPFLKLYFRLFSHNSEE